MPEGTRWKWNSLSPTTTVWPALRPPLARTTSLAGSARKSTSLPLPSSPQWPPTTTITDIRSVLLTKAAGDYSRKFGLLVGEGGDAGQGLAFEQLQGGATTSGDVRNLGRQASLLQGGNGIATADDGQPAAGGHGLSN